MSGLWEEAAVPERTHAEHHTSVPQLTVSICGLFLCFFSSKFMIQRLDWEIPILQEPNVSFFGRIINQGMRAASGRAELV